MAVVPPAGAVALTGGRVGVAAAERVAAGAGRTACLVGTGCPCEVCPPCDVCGAADVGGGEGARVGVGEGVGFTSGSGGNGSVTS